MKTIVTAMLLLFSSQLLAQKSEYIVRDTFIAGEDIYLITESNVLKAGVKYFTPWYTDYCDYLYLGISSSPKAYVKPALKYVNYGDKVDRKYCDYYKKLIKSIAYRAARGEPTVITVIENIDNTVFTVRLEGQSYSFKN